MLISVDIDAIEKDAASMDAAFDGEEANLTDDTQCRILAERLRVLIVKLDAGIAALTLFTEQLDGEQGEELDGMSIYTPQLLPGLKKHLFEQYRRRYQSYRRNVERRDLELRGIIPIEDV